MKCIVRTFNVEMDDTLTAAFYNPHLSSYAPRLQTATFKGQLTLHEALPEMTSIVLISNPKKSTYGAVASFISPDLDPADDFIDATRMSEDFDDTQICSFKIFFSGVAADSVEEIVAPPGNNFAHKLPVYHDSQLMTFHLQ